MEDKLIPHSRTAISQKDAEAVTETILTGHVAAGDRVGEFEKAVGDAIGVSHAAAVSNGTAALHLALLALGIGEGDEVILPSYVCSAVLHAVHHAGATPIASDIGEDYNICSADVAKKKTSRTRAVIVPHMFGTPADIDAIKQHSIPVIEDCAGSIGAHRDGEPCGGAGDIAIFSFYATKMLTTGEGGMVASRSRELIDSVRDLRDYDEKDEYRVRYNYKMTDMGAALGLSQLSRLDEFIRRRREIADRYSEAFDDLSIQIPSGATHEGSVYHRYVISTAQKAEDVCNSLQTQGVCAKRPVYYPLHRYLGQGECPRTDDAWKHAVSIPIYPSLTDEEVTKVIDAVKKVSG